MKIQKEKLALVLGYTLFALAAFIFFFYRTFPLETLERQALAWVEAESGCRVKIAARRLALPLHLSGEGIVASCPSQVFGGKGTERIDLKMTTLDMRLAPFSLLFKQHAKIAFQSELGGGKLSGNLSIEQEESGLAFDLLSIEGNQVNLSEAGLGNFGLLSSLQGEGAWLEKDPLKGTGQMRFTLENGRFSEIGGWSIPIGELAFSKLAAQLSWKEGRIDFNQFSAQGEMADIQGERANLQLRNPIDASLLNLVMRATPKGNIKEMAMLFVQGYNGRDPLKIRVNGALRRPQLSVNGRQVPLGT